MNKLTHEDVVILFLAYLRKNKLSKSDYARLNGVTNATISHFINGAHRVPEYILNDLGLEKCETLYTRSK